MIAAFLPVLLLFAAQGTEGFKWKDKPADNAVIKECEDAKLTIPWDFDLEGKDSIRMIKWFHKAEGKEEKLIGIWFNGKYQHVDPGFPKERVVYMKHGGLTFTKAKASDTGKLTIKAAIGDQNGGVKDYSRHVTVIVGGAPAAKEMSPVYDAATKSHHIMLSCGMFTERNPPTTDVQWEIPGGAKVKSTKFADGYFYLQLPNPVKGGEYKCIVPATGLKSCKKAGGKRDLSKRAKPAGGKVAPEKEKEKAEAAKPAPAKPTEIKITVDETKGRLSLLEADKKMVLAKVDKIDTSTFDAMKKRLDLVEKQVVFFARLKSKTAVDAKKTVILDDVVTNIGNAYSASTGVFTAPVAGTYFLSAQTTSGSKTQVDADLFMKKGDATLCVAFNTYSVNLQGASCQAVVTLQKDDKVNLVSPSKSYYWSMATAFTGFLIRATA